MAIRQIRSRLVDVVLASILLPILPSQAQSVDELQRQLEAQRQINAQLRRRVLTLEETIEQIRDGNETIDGNSDTQAASDREPRDALPPPADDTLEESEIGALEEALVQRGSSVLSPGSVQFVPAVSWVHSGSSALSTETNAYTSSLSARLGLRGSTMLSVTVPYVMHAENEIGENSGIGDMSISVTKQLIAQNRNRPSVLASLGYVVPTGEDVFESTIPLGSGFHTIQATLSSVKAVDPLAFFGDISYSHPFSRTIDSSKFQPGNTFGLGAGFTLAATPEIALSSSINFNFISKFKTDGISITGTDRTIGTLGVTAGFLLSRNAYFSVSGQFGVTDDAPDLALGVALPVRF